MPSATCTLIYCTADSSLGEFGTVLVWLSHVLLGFSALLYSSGVLLIYNGALKISQFHAIDSVLKEKGITSTDKAFEAFSVCEDQAVKQMAFWLVSLQRTWGTFQSTIGLGLWVVILLMPVKHRAAVHFLVAYLQIICGLIPASIVWGGPIPDLVVKFGGPKAGGSNKIAHETSGTGIMRPDSSALKWDFWSHTILGTVNLTLGVLCLLSD